MRKTTIERLVQELADLYYVNHDSTLKAMVRVIRSFRLQVIREYKIDMGDYRGRVDIYAYNGNTLGLEFDAKLTPRYNSIEKLEYLNPDITLLVGGEGKLGDQIETIDDILRIQSQYLYLVSLAKSTYWSRDELERP
jgi:hypothetical protein